MGVLLDHGVLLHFVSLLMKAWVVVRPYAENQGEIQVAAK